MNWYKLAQYSVDDYQPTPIPALPKDAIMPRDNGEIIEPLPDTPTMEDREYPIAAAIIASKKLFKGRTHGEAIQKAIDAGYVKKDEDGYLVDTDGNSLAFSGAIDLFLTNKGRLINRFKASELGEATGAENIPEQDREAID